jgi:hypothetical protein
VRANASAGFSLVTYTGTGSAASIGHGLGAKPGFSICKKRDGSVDGWYILHSSLGATKYVALNSINAAATYSGLWNDTEPTSTLFYLGNDFGSNQSGVNYISYHWASVSGYSSIGNFTGNSSADGPFVFTGMRPRCIFIKDTTSSSNWRIYDTARDPYNLTTAKLYPNLSGTENSAPGESASTNTLDVLSNGFKLRTSNSETNFSGDTYIYIAFSENPFQYARAR